MSRAGEYAAAIANIEQSRSAAQANAVRANGGIWGSTIANIGQYIGRIPQQRAALKRAEAQAAEQADQQARSKRKDEADALAEQRLRDLFATGQTPTPSQLFGAVGYERGIKIAEGLKSLGTASTIDPKVDFDKTQKVLRDVLLGMQALPEDVRAQVYPGVRNHLVERGIVPADAAPEAYDSAWWTQTINYAKEPPKAETPPSDYTLGNQRFSGKDNSVIATGEQRPGTAPNEGSFEAYATETDPAKRAKILADRKAYMQADDRPPAVHVSVNGQGVGTLDQGGLELAATDYRLTHRLPARNAEQNGAIISAAAAQAKSLGNSPVATIQKQAAYAGDSKALAKMQGMSASAEAFESKAIAQTDIIADLSSKVPRTTYPIINAALQSGRTNISGDANATKLANAIETFSEEYAKVMNGATGSSAAASDSSRAAAKRLINTAMSKGTMTEVLNLMKREMNLTMQGYDSVINHITDRMGGGQPGQAPPAGGQNATDPLGIR